MTNDKLAEDRALRSQQNQEYADSLAKDLAKKEEKEKIRLEAERKVLRKQTIQLYREKIQADQPPPTSGPPYHHLLIRYPSGARLQLRLSTTTDTVTQLFDAILRHPACPDFFTVRSILPSGEIRGIYPPWYSKILGEEFGTEDFLTPQKTSLQETCPDHSCLFINMIHH
ncbi:hypothetical protein GCK72_004250 [Caenorhabditis remanei]|uniref:UBX domain-containing protein n=1 Tax=Caenorhabditis remanei TaxID=31234 RepID=A0A6A5HD48_CAERE|nr:hypothetical protein GCK72_004250 [Caenorhabditis remanei]KAF1764303.1 hypothetical protein GCK72_004250 [Caenorhabditis remanei]